MLIWQEFRGIVSDVWDKIAAGAGWLLKGIAANYQLIIVLVAGVSISLVLMGIPVFAALDFTFGRTFQAFGEPARPPKIEGSLIGFLLMFFIGVVTLMLTTELANRIDKRLKGKPKEQEAKQGRNGGSDES